MVGVLWVGDVKPGAKRLVGQRESSVDLRFNVIWANEGAVGAGFLLCSSHYAPLPYATAVLRAFQKPASLR